MQMTSCSACVRRTPPRRQRIDGAQATCLLWGLLLRHHHGARLEPAASLLLAFTTVGLVSGARLTATASPASPASLRAPRVAQSEQPSGGTIHKPAPGPLLFPSSHLPILFLSSSSVLSSLVRPLSSTYHIQFRSTLRTPRHSSLQPYRRHLTHAATLGGTPPPLVHTSTRLHLHLHSTRPPRSLHPSASAAAYSSTSPASTAVRASSKMPSAKEEELQAHFPFPLYTCVPRPRRSCPLRLVLAQAGTAGPCAQEWLLAVAYCSSTPGPL